MRSELAMNNLILNNGVAMPCIGFGVYQISNREVVRCVRDAIDCGYRLIDTAQWYGNEEGVGQAVAECGVPRERLFLVTKLQSPRRVEESVDASLRKLRSEYLDLLLIHWPMGGDAAVWLTMQRLYDRGKLRAIGLSNFYDNDLDTILRHTDVTPQVIQQELHPFRQQPELIDFYRRLRIVPQAWSPLACGKQGIFTDPLLSRIGSAYGKSPAQVSLRFLLQCGICPIPKSTHKARMVENLDIFDFSLSASDISAIRTLDLGHGLFGW